MYLLCQLLRHSQTKNKYMMHQTFSELYTASVFLEERGSSIIVLDKKKASLAGKRVFVRLCNYLAPAVPLFQSYNENPSQN